MRLPSETDVFQYLATVAQSNHVKSTLPMRIRLGVLRFAADHRDVLFARDGTELVADLHAKIIEHHVAVVGHLVPALLVKDRHVVPTIFHDSFIFVVPYHQALSVPAHVKYQLFLRRGYGTGILTKICQTDNVICLPINFLCVAVITYHFLISRLIWR